MNTLYQTINFHGQITGLPEAIPLFAVIERYSIVFNYMHHQLDTNVLI